MTNDDLHDDCDHVDSFSDLNGDLDDLQNVDSFDDLNGSSPDLQRVDSLDDLNGNESSTASEELENVDSFAGLDDDLVIHRDATSEATADASPEITEPTLEQDAYGSEATPTEEADLPAEPISHPSDAIEEVITEAPEASAESVKPFADPIDEIIAQTSDSSLDSIEEFSGVIDSGGESSALLELPEDDSSISAVPADEQDLDELLGDLDNDASESDSAAVSEEIGIMGESESAAVSEELVEVGACARIVISPNPKTVVSGERIVFTIEAYDKDNNPLPAPAVKWSAKGGEITKSGVYTAGRATGLFSVKASTKGVTDRHEGLVEAAPTRNEWVLASFYSAVGIYLALALTYFLDPAVLGQANNFIGYFNFDWAIATILVGPCVICFISSALGLLSKPKGKEWLLLLPSLGPVIPVILGAIAIMSLLAL